MGLAKNFLIYGLGGAASRLTAIFLVPLYTRALSISDYGMLEILLSLYTGAILIAGVQSESALIRDYYTAKEHKFLENLQWSAVLITVSGTFGLAVIFYSAEIFGFLPNNVKDYILILLAMAFSAQLFGLQLIVIRFSGSSVFFVILSFLDLSLSALASVLLITVFEMGLIGALLGILFAKIICLLIAWPRTFGFPKIRPFPAALIRSMLSYSVPTMPSVFFNWIQNNGARVVLAFFLTLNDVAIAGIAMKVAALYGFIIYSFRLAWEPYAFKNLAVVKTDPQFFNRTFEWYVLTMLIVACATTIISPLVVSIFAPPAYNAAVSLTGMFIFGQFWIGAAGILGIGIHGARVTSRLTYVYGAGALANVLLLATLSTTFGVTAAAIGFGLSAIVSALLAMYYGEHHFNTGYRLKLVLPTIASSLIFAIVSYLVFESGERQSVTSTDSLYAYAILAMLAVGVLSGTIWIGFGRERVLEIWTEMTAMLKRGS